MIEASMFDKIISVDNLRKAWIKAYQYARTEDVYFDEYAYSVFADHLESRLLGLSKELSEGTYQPDPLRYITIPKGNKERKIYFLSPKDTVVIQAIINLIGPEFEQTFIKDSYGYRLNINLQESKDVYHSWQEKYSEYVATVRGFVKYGLNSYYLITDIENFYPTISQDWLIGLISSKVDVQTLKLIEFFIRNTVINSIEETESLMGIPAGVIYSHFFANIYLNEFDHRAQKVTLGYARYVDDICLVCEGLEEIENVKKDLSDYLGRWNQKFKEFEKTTIQPIFNIEPLFEHTRKMKYAIRLDLMETYEESSEAISMVQETEKPFYRLYKIAEREGDLNQIVNQAGLVIALLKDEQGTDFADIIYSLLETHPVRPSTLKAVLVYLLEMEHPNPSDKFMTFFFEEQKKSDYILTLFLRLLPHFDWDNDFKSEILSLCSSNQNYLVRATAFFILSQKRILFSEELFNKMFSDENSDFVKSRLLDCLRNIDGTLNPNKLLNILENHKLSVALIRSYSFLVENGELEKDFINILWAYIKDKKVSSELLFYILYLALLQGFYWVVEEILNIDINREILLVAPSISLEVLNKLASKSEIIKLVSLADQVRRLGFVDTALVGYFEASSRPVNDLSSDISTAVKSVEQNAGLPSWISESTTTRQIYKQLSGDQDYLCQYLDDGKGKTAILEIVSFERIKSGGFPSYEDWATFLNNLSASRVIPKIHLAKYSDIKFACLYEIPDGFSTIANILINDSTKISLDQSNIFLLGEKLLKIMSEIQRDDFYFHTIDPLSVLWNPLNSTTMLLGVGGNLGTGKYHCGIQGCKTPFGEDEVGVSAAAYNFGLFILQLLSGSCSLEQIKNIKSKYLKLKLTDVLATLNVLPHYKMILGRLLNSEPNKRYNNLSNLLSDFKQANKFRFDLHDLKQRDKDTKLALTLIDFIFFRLRVISRNPNLKSNSSIWRSKSIIDELANTLQYVSPQLLAFWSVGLENRHEDNVFPQPRELKKISLEGRRLIDVAYGWEKLCEKYELKDNKLTPLARVFLYRCVVVEAMASFSGLMGSLSKIQVASVEKRIIEFSDTLDNLITQQESEKEITFRLGTNDYKINISKKDLFEIRQLLNWWSKTAVSRESISSLKVLGLFWTLIHCSMEIIVDENILIDFKTLISSSSTNLSQKFTWVLLSLLPTMDKQINSFQDFFDDSTADNNLVQNDVWNKYVELQRCVMELNPARRVVANVHSYQVKNYKGEAEGLLEYGWLLTKKIKTFDTRQLYISGNPALFDAKAGRPVLIDLILSSNKLSSLLAPVGKLTELPYKRSSTQIFDVKEFIQNYKRLLFAAVVTFFSLIGMYIAEIIKVAQTSPDATSSSLIGTTLGAFFGLLFAVFGERVIKEIYPEDNDIVVGRSKKSKLNKKQT